MQITIDGRMILPHMTGVGRYLLDLLPALCEADPQLALTLWLQAGLPANHAARQLAGERLRLHTVAFRHMSLGGQLLLHKELAAAPPDLFHYPHFDLPWLVGDKVVATIYDLKYIARPDFFPRGRAARHLVMRWMMADTCRRARRVIAISHSTAQDLTRYLNVPPEKIRVAPLGVDRRYTQRLPQAALDDLRRRYGLAWPYLLFIGERRPHKNIANLIEAFAIFRRMTGQPYQLVIAGKRYANYVGPERVTEELGLQDCVRFIDHPPDEDLPALYQAAEAFIFLSYYEGFGLPVLEAMASGVPVVASNETSLPEAAGEAGLLVPPMAPEQAALALRQIIPGGASREACIAAGVQRAGEFTWARCARQTLSIYQEALTA